MVKKQILDWSLTIAATLELRFSCARLRCLANFRQGLLKVEHRHVKSAVDAQTVPSTPDGTTNSNAVRCCFLFFNVLGSFSRQEAVLIPLL